VQGSGSAECWSLDNPDSGRGSQYDLIVIDEAGQVEKLQHAWEQSIRPMLAARRGKAWFLSTPTGTAHYIHALFRKGQGLVLPGSEWRSWQMPTSTNPTITASEIAAMKADMSEQAFEQEVLAEFITWDGAVFTHLHEAVLDPGTVPQGKAAVIGVDWAGSSGGGDYTAYVVLSDTGHVLDLSAYAASLSCSSAVDSEVSGSATVSLPSWPRRKVWERYRTRS
jgi:hypothetical protein